MCVKYLVGLGEFAQRTSQFELCISIKNGEPNKVGAIDCSDDKRTTPSTAKWQTIENQSAGSFQLKNRYDFNEVYSLI